MGEGVAGDKGGMRRDARHSTIKIGSMPSSFDGGFAYLKAYLDGGMEAISSSFDQKSYGLEIRILLL